MISQKRNKLSAIIITLILFGSIIFALAFGSVDLSLSAIWQGLFGDDRVAKVILVELRLPRVIGAILAGAGLATAGHLLQTVTDNELCAPNIIGINSGAGFAVMLMLCLCPMLWQILPFAAFIGAVTTTFLVLALSYAGNSYEQKSSVILAGVAVSSMLSAGISFLSLEFPDALSSYAAFSVGGFSGVSIKKLIIPFGVILICFVISLIFAPKIQLLCLGDDGAATLGINVKRVRTLCVILASALCAAVVSFAGLLGFVGLIVPHITKKLTRGGLRTGLVFSALIGAILVILSDLLGRVLFSPGEIPAGIFLAFIGAPFFIRLLVKRRRRK